ncbi:hypothetical protein BDC45DRAFT_576418 [Circinella umbellata]|nr:hypothetical protein BDC45DRAFT_576418 [Circinella umbellata]
MTFPDGLTSRTADAHGYKKTGGEVLLQLDAFDSTKEHPVEILHTMMLGPTKYLAFSTIKYLGTGETDQLQAKLQSCHSRAFGRVLGNCLQPIISNTPKLHYLHHLKEDLKRFATAIHTESEKELFGRQMMFKHVIDGGAWVDGDFHVSPSSGIQHYLNNHPNFENSILVMIESILITTIPQRYESRGHWIFYDHYSHSLRLAHIVKIYPVTRNSLEDQIKFGFNIYNLVLDHSSQNVYAYGSQFSLSLYCNTQKDSIGNPVCTSVIKTIECQKNEVTLIEVVDLQAHCCENKEYNIININKFGSLWYMLSNNFY